MTEKKAKKKYDEQKLKFVKAMVDLIPSKKEMYPNLAATGILDLMKGKKSESKKRKTLPKKT